MWVERCQAPDEQWGGGVGCEGNTTGQAWVGVVGARHPVDERPHDRNAGEHGQVGHDCHPDCTFLRQHDRRAVTDDPADLGSADKRRYRRDGGQYQGMGEIHVADAFLLATYFSPFLIGMGEKPQNVMDHASHSFRCCHRPPMERSRPVGRSQDRARLFCMAVCPV
ncbi:hypothetical protein D3C81_1684950 [compost metagenome]